MVQKVIQEFNYLATLSCSGEAAQFSLMVVVEVVLVYRHLGDQNVSEST